MKRRVLIVVATVVVLALAFAVGWLLYTPSGLRFAVARAESFLAPRLQVERVEGSVARGVKIGGLRWHDVDGGIDARLASGEIQIALGALLGGRVHVVRADLQGLSVQLTPVPPRPSEPSARAPLDPPVPIVVDAFRLRDARIVNAGEEVVHVRDANLAASWTQAALTVQRFDLLADQGEVHFDGTAAGRDRYRGEGRGRFRWQAGDREVAGTLTARASESVADFTVNLTAPERADLTLALRQEAHLPWRFTLQVPAYEADFHGDGTLEEARASGRVVLQGTPLDIRALHVQRAGDDIAIDGDVGFAGGTVKIDASLQPKAQPLAGRAQIQWDRLAIPASLVGQPLQTEGKLEAHGSLEAYAADGTLRLGPPRRLADIQLHLTGTPQTVQLSQFDIVQPQGRLTAAGMVQLQPELSWTVGAAARAFDPGALLRDWPGRLDFRLASDGKPSSMRVALQDLTGRLRDRAVAGSAALTLDDRTLVGSAALSSGQSTVRIDASRDAKDEAHARADLSMTSLGDWLPGAQGSLNGRIEAQGRWPDLTVTTDLRAQGIQIAGNSVDDAHLQAQVVKPLTPSGTVALDAHGATTAGFQFATVRLRADGDQAKHQLKVDATGPRLTLGLDVSGGLDSGVWHGTISRLAIASPDVARLSLQAPSRPPYPGTMRRWVRPASRMATSGCAWKATVVRCRRSMSATPRRRCR